MREKDVVEIDGEEYLVKSVMTVSTATGSWGVPSIVGMVADGLGEYIVLKKPLPVPTRHIANKI